MRTGRPAKPTALKKRQGTLRKHRTNKREPKLKSGEPAMPADFDDVAKSEWRRVVAEAFKLEVLTKADRGIVEAAARAYSAMRKAQKFCDEQGLTYETEGTEGQRMIKANPAAAIAAEAARRWAAALVQLGLSPSARSKVSTVDPNEDEDASAQYFH